MDDQPYKDVCIWVAQASSKLAWTPMCKIEERSIKMGWKNEILEWYEQHKKNAEQQRILREEATRKQMIAVVKCRLEGIGVPVADISDDAFVFDDGDLSITIDDLTFIYSGVRQPGLYLKHKLPCGHFHFLRTDAKADLAKFLAGDIQVECHECRPVPMTYVE
jgi:hypothetical protein